MRLSVARCPCNLAFKSTAFSFSTWKKGNYSVFIPYWSDSYSHQNNCVVLAWRQWITFILGLVKTAKKRWKCSTLSYIWYLNPANSCNERWKYGYSHVYSQNIWRACFYHLLLSVLAQLSHHRCATDLSSLMHCGWNSYSWLTLSHSSVALALASHG